MQHYPHCQELMEVKIESKILVLIALNLPVKIIRGRSVTFQNIKEHTKLTANNLPQKLKRSGRSRISQRGRATLEGGR